MKTAWIVTMEVNAYDQEGEYFVAWFSTKPTFAQLKATVRNESDVTIGKLTRGGGRQGYEDVWYNLAEAKEGVVR